MVITIPVDNHRGSFLQSILANRMQCREHNETVRGIVANCLRSYEENWSQNGPLGRGALNRLWFFTTNASEPHPRHLQYHFLQLESTG